MLTRIGTLVVSLVASAAGAAVLIGARSAASRSARSDGLVVHEWGTFTSVAGADGQAVQWTPLSAPSDLPCFVTMLDPDSPKGDLGGVFLLDTTSHPTLANVRGTVRMETPVMYFYSPTETEADVRVTFPHGLITEWYPAATVPFAAPGTDMANATGAIEWSHVRVRPGGATTFPREAAPSPYYEARATDATPLEVGAQHEKFLFYRGIANIPVPVRARLDDDGSVFVETAGTAVPTLVLFVNSARGKGYRIVDRPSERLTIAQPALTNNLDSLARDLETMLVGQGLYAAEARAMVNTWRASWFEAGTRLLYLVPRATTNAMLPVRIDPAPAQLTRVFVGRVEIITPEVEAAVSQAVRGHDIGAEKAYARFLEPIAARILADSRSATERSDLQAAMRAVVAARRGSAESQCGQ